MIKVQAPARICFFGDHQDYLNLPVIAGTINRFIHIEGELINEKSYSIHLFDIEAVSYTHLTLPTNREV